MATRKYRRLPNGCGSIVHLNGKLRHPFLAKRRAGTDPHGHAVYITVGTFSTYSEAFNALMQCNRQDLPPAPDVSFAELFERFTRDVLELPSNGRVLSSSSVDGYRYAFRAVPGLHRRSFSEITAPELQQALENAGGSASRQTKIKLLFSRLFKYADYLGITDRDLSGFVRITKKDYPVRRPFSASEVRDIWRMPPSRWRDCALVMLYSGIRVGELFTVHDVGPDFFRAGLKTEAGINRVVPIHPEIAALVPGLFPLSGDRRLVERWFSRNLPGHTPHDCRRTFVTFADECGMSPTACRQIVGHSSGDVHAVKYTLHSPAFLCAEIKKLRYEAL